MNGGTELPAVATASYALSRTLVSAKEARACQELRIHRHVALGRGCPPCTMPEGTPGLLRHGGTAVIRLRLMEASAAFCPGHTL